ncbi:uncharacterized protein LOC142768322 [Rhipicephalus microplus]|uniref:uncharacterized protein LOC142768322 n=1 Tax=Rhipicephalus microplus TaxID=6941 RepID=UPI003F6A821E
MACFKFDIAMIPLLRLAMCLGLLLSSSTITSSEATEVAEQAMLPPADLMRYFGYNVEVHNVTTADGYILEVDSMPSKLTDNATTSRTPLLLVHGLLTNAATWTANLRFQCPGIAYRAVLKASNVTLPTELLKDYSSLACTETRSPWPAGLSSSLPGLLDSPFLVLDLRVEQHKSPLLLEDLRRIC